MRLHYVASGVTLLAAARSERATVLPWSGAERKPAQAIGKGGMQRRDQGTGGRRRAAAAKIDPKREGVVASTLDLVKISLPPQHLEAVPSVKGQCRVVICDDVQIEEATVVDPLRGASAATEDARRASRTSHSDSVRVSSAPARPRRRCASSVPSVSM